MKTNEIEDLVTEVLMYLSSSGADAVYIEMVSRLLHLKSDDRMEALLEDCLELRQNILSFKIRETQKRIETINKYINETRFTNGSKGNELSCLETLYQQSKQQNNRLCLLYKLDHLLLVVTTMAK